MHVVVRGNSCSMQTALGCRRCFSATTRFVPCPSREVQGRPPGVSWVPARKSISCRGPQLSCNGCSSTIQLERAFSHLCKLLLAGLIVTATPSASAVEATIRFPASKDPEIRAAQQVLVEAWAYVGAYYIDPTFNGLDWQKEINDALSRTVEARTAADVYAEAPKLLSKLDDPYTRVLEQQESRLYTTSREGKVYTTGIVVNKAQNKEMLRVSYVVPSSPAERAGIQIGDDILQINGRPTALEDIQLIRKHVGVEPVHLRLLSQAAPALQQPHVLEAAGLTASEETHSAALTGMSNSYREYEVDLTPEELELQAVQYAMIPKQGSQKGVGYIRIVQFNMTTGGAVQKAILDLQAQGAESLLLDLRDNPGGAVAGGYEVAQLFLPPGSVFCYASDRSGQEEEAKLDSSSPITTAPLEVLVNGGTASTSELLAAALRDNYSAVLVGEQTFGKGRTQLVIPLRDGSTLLVSNIAYKTPSHQDVQRVGLHPDVACRPERVEQEYWMDGARSGASLLDDPCIRLAVSSQAMS